MRLYRSLLVFVLAAAAFAASAGETIEAKASYGEPALSPDRSEIAFVSGGDIWTVPAVGGEARLLVAHSATESRPLYSPDGTRLAFISTRTGNGDIYVLNFASGDVQRITFDDALERLDAWSRDGKWLYFSSIGHDIGSSNDIYRVSAAGGTPMAVSDDRYTQEFFAAPAPDGQTLAFSGRGFGAQQWWRKGHSHLDESEIWLRHEGAAAQPARYERVTPLGAKNFWPMWNGDGSVLYFVSDRGGAQNIWAKVDGELRQITTFNNGRVLWPSISYDGAAIVFERNFGIWMLDIASGKTHEVPIRRRGSPSGPGSEHLMLTGNYRDLVLSPDGKKLAFAAHGELFAVSAKDGGEAVRLTHTTSMQENPCWAPDSRRLAYASSRDGVAHLYLYDFANGVETQLTQDPTGDAQPYFSPDGKTLAFHRGGQALCVLDLQTKQTHTVVTAPFAQPPLNAKRPYVWSPDGHWLVYMAPSGKSFRNACVVDADGKGTCHQVSFLSNVYSNTVAWSPDGTFLLLHSGQRTEKGGVERVDLVPRKTKFREDQFRELFKDETPHPPAAVIESKHPTSPVLPGLPTTEKRPADNPPQVHPSEAAVNATDPKKTKPKPVEIQFEGIRQRQSLLPLGLDIQSVTISPDGKTGVLTSGTSLYTVGLEDGNQNQAPRLLITASGAISDPQFSPDSKEVYYLDQGHIQIASLDARTSRGLGVTSELDTDFDKEKIAVFEQAWCTLRDHFFDPKFNGADWPAVRKEYLPRVAGARTPDELRRILSLMLGELNASHLGISMGGSGGEQIGRLGLHFDRGEYETQGRFRVSEVLTSGPASQAGIKNGEYVLSVDGRTLGEHSNLDELLAHKIGHRTALSVAEAPKGKTREVALRPTGMAAEKVLMYRQWVERKRAYVDTASGGRLGYVHIADMSENSLNQLYVDLDAENHAREGVVIDIRNNDGGFVDPYAIDVLARRPYLMMTPRGQSPVPGRTLLGQRALELPTVLVTNPQSLSDAESFTEGYRSLKLGKVVGEATAGWIVFTSNELLLDGSTLRIPHTRVVTIGGEDMEMHPRPVDIEVVRAVGESYTGHDAQLDAAAESLLKDLGPKK